MQDPNRSAPNRSGPFDETHTKLDGLVVAIVTSRDDAGDFLIRELQRLRVVAHYIMPSAEPLPADADVIYCDYTPDLVSRVSWLTSEGKTALVLILPQTESISIEALAAMTPNAVISRPFNSNSIVASLVVARAGFRYEQRLRAKVERLEENMRSLRTVERAKAMLMASRGLTDDEAYRHIRSQAMAKRMSVAALATAIVSSFEILGGDAT